MKIIAGKRPSAGGTRQRMDKAEFIRSQLVNLGFDQSKYGYLALREILALTMEDPRSMYGGFDKCILPKVADTLNVSLDQIRHNVGRLIHGTKRNDLWKEIFGPAAEMKITLAHFVCGIVDYWKVQEQKAYAESAKVGLTI